jgi:hypothetical protein
MPKSIYDIENPGEDGLIVIQENKSRFTHQKELILNQPPWVSQVPYGIRMGQHCIFIQLSYSPLKGFPYENERSRNDWDDNPVMTIGDLVHFCKNRAPNLVYIIGGEPMFKWDDEVALLCSAIHKETKKQVFVETSGVILPNCFEKSVDTSFFPSHVILKPQIFEPVPSHESGGYFQHIYKTLDFWDNMIEFGLNWHFDVNMDQDEDLYTLELTRIITFLSNLRDKMNRPFYNKDIIFTPKVPFAPGYGLSQRKQQHLTHYQDLVHLVGTLLLNLPEMNLMVQPNNSLL